MMQDLIKSGIVFVDFETTMEDVVKVMRDHNISSVFVSDQQQVVVGIITERDIVQKFTLLPSQDKLAAKAGAFMNRPVHFARLESLEQDTYHMLFEKQLRHFPICVGDSHHVQDLIGIITVTDIARNVLSRQKLEKNPPATQKIVLITGNPSAAQNYKQLFEALHFLTITEGGHAKLFKSAEDFQLPILCDLDGLTLDEAKNQLRLLKNFSGIFVLLSSDENLVKSLMPLLNGPQHFISRKPLNMSLILKLLKQVKVKG